MLSDFEREDLMLEARDLLSFSDRGFKEKSTVVIEDASTYRRKQTFLKRLEGVLNNVNTISISEENSR